jgi:hypothetical protein
MALPVVVAKATAEGDGCAEGKGIFDDSGNS